ncbi:Uma2 family endonuclease [Geminocystis sp. GBBB08]|uniref:Uma2 family endonuclease n=1 Tax=Geminocystis sp. GBBB08 TaxID=2604140 RepID=UPI0027E388F8|nr:Uma2 family endonuclease [Geminocystis sp. GBBB08]MBL1209723.1 Uma2 family endonuclease [Geminocystis sp. GBBB08]
MTTLTLNLNPTLILDDEQFISICNHNQNFNFERNHKGELIIMSPTGSETGQKNWSIAGQLWAWNNRYKLGIGFDSSTGFKLPNGAIRSPDVSWIKLERWEKLTPEERRKFAAICPDFVIELLSVNDEIEETRKKMTEYLENGLNLGWLIDPQSKTVEVYQANQSVITLNNPQTLYGENILPDFVLDLTDILTD